MSRLHGKARFAKRRPRARAVATAGTKRAPGARARDAAIRASVARLWSVAAERACSTFGESTDRSRVLQSSRVQRARQLGRRVVTYQLGRRVVTYRGANHRSDLRPLRAASHPCSSTSSFSRLDRVEDARSAIVAQYGSVGRFWGGNGDGSAAPRHRWQNDPSPEAAIFSDNPVRRGGIEPPTRGFSVPCPIWPAPRNSKAKRVSEGPPLSHLHQLERNGRAGAG
jgi:hypothetical protein